MRTSAELVGILLAAGRATRFGSNKLLHPLSDGTPMALASASALRVALPRTVAVIREEDGALAALFAGYGIETVIAERAHAGMGASLAAGVAATAGAGGWLVALGDMPYIDPQTVVLVASRLQAGARLVAPSYRGRRGHPVGFDHSFRSQLLALDGDQGARALLQQHAGELALAECDDPGVLVDIDQPAALITPA